MATSREADLTPGRVRQRFEQWIGNPHCAANVRSAVSNVRMERVAKRMGLDGEMGQSPFAIAGGNSFERTLFRESGKRLRAGLVETGVLEASEEGWQDFRTADKGGPCGRSRAW